MVLNVRLRDEATFAAYHEASNAEAVRCLAALGKRNQGPDAGHRQVYLWGACATGKSHLLQALCHEFSRPEEGRSVYLPLREFDESDVDILKGLGELELVCIDDLDAVIHHASWVRELFNLINALHQAGHLLVLASRQNPSYFKDVLPDLISRFLGGPVFKLHALDDVGKLGALRVHAKQRGMSLSDEAGRYLLNYCPRDLVSLLNLLDRLDVSSLAAKRRLTVPFIKSVLQA